jgi:hypothetical protein
MILIIMYVVANINPIPCGLFSVSLASAATAKLRSAICHQDKHFSGPGTTQKQPTQLQQQQQQRQQAEEII